MSATLALRILLAPLLIGLASIIARKWGPSAGGWFVALPLTSGPVLVLLALERGPSFAKAATVGALLAIVSLTVFALAYAWSARKLGWRASSGIGCAAFLASTWALTPLSAPLGACFAIACAALALGILLMPVRSRARGAAPTPRWDIPLRMLLAALLVWALTGAAGRLGPQTSGLLTPFPIATCILAAFTHRHEGAASANELLFGLLTGLFSFATFLLVLGATLGRWPVGASFGAALVATLVVHGGVWRELSRSAQRPAPVLEGVHD